METDLTRMFWKYHSGTVSHVDTLLDKEGVTLQEILEEEDIIQECKSQNKKLVEFLTKQEVLSELLDLILQEPSEELDERLRFKLPNIASEVITCDVAQINEKLSSDTSLLDKLYAFLETSPPLNPLLTSFFSKTFGILITRRPEQNWYSYQYTCLQVIEYIKSKPKFTSLLLTHLATSAVMDLLLRLITCVDGTENKQNILTWLNEEKLIERVLSLFAPPDGGGIEEDSETAFKVGEQHDNAGQLLVEIIRSCRDSQLISPPAEKFLNPLLVTAESEETVSVLLGYMLDGPPVETCLTNGVEVLQALLEVRRPAPQGGGFYPYSTEQDTVNCQADIERQEAVMRSTVQCLVPRLPQLTSLLLSPPLKPPVPTTAGLLQVPLGRSRLALTKLLASLLHTNSPSLNQALAEANTLTVLLDLFFEFRLNNFLHAQVQSCLHSVIFWSDGQHETEAQPAVTPDTADVAEASLETPKISETGEETEPQHPLEVETFDNPALVHLLTSANLLDRLITAWTSPLAPSVSYMGHVTKISNDLVTACGNVTSSHPIPTCQSRTLLLQLLAKLPEETLETWAGIVDGKLTETNTINEIKPAEDKRTLDDDDDEDSDFTDIQFPQDSVLEKMFSDYQMQEMSENFIDSFGFQDDEFTDSDVNVSRGMRKLNNVNLLMQTDDSTKQAIFDSVCEQRIKRFGSDQDDQDDPWADKTAEISFSKSEVKQSSAADSSDDDDDNEPAPDKMEVDNDQDPWDTISAPAGTGGQVAMDTTGSPWDVSTPQQPDTSETGWADFAAFPSTGNDSGASDIIEKQQGEVMSVEDRPEEEDGEGGDTWRPSMASSPEATMLDVTAEDIESENEDKEEPTTKEEMKDEQTTKEETKEEEVTEKVKDEKEDVREDPKKEVSDERLLGDVASPEKENKDELADNFAFLSDKGLITSESSNNSSNITTQTQPSKRETGDGESPS